MKKIISALLISALTISSIAGCANSGAASSAAAPASAAAASTAPAAKKIVIGASPTPHAIILKEAAKLLKAKGYDLEIKEFNDYVIPNTSLESKEIDANYFQHQPYLDQFNKEKGTNL
ncbi:MAG TPA: MetQ/NlpA family ABC transporter substrate-binding protein, partial [Caproiciproducens sp.]|nr:MetQ/NlpA family ABC transporter substrate-binding protein [Caproiciproducens sp.]